MSLETILIYLNKPFPFFKNRWQRLLASMLVALFIYGFLMIFQPFGLAGLSNYKSEVILGYALITFMVIFISLFIAPEFFHSYFESWTIKKNFIYISSHFLIIAILNWYFNHHYHQENSFHSLSFFVFITMSVGVFPSFLLVYFVEKWLSNANEEIASTINNEIHSVVDETNQLSMQDIEIKIISKNKNEDFILPLSNLLYIKSEGNYVNICFTEDNKINEVLIRNSISAIETHLSEIPGVIRCHRSYLANFNNIDHVSGNAHSFSLHFTGVKKSIPVSRAFPKEQLKRYRLS